ncbi:hypothetical protein CEXT_460461 [Caerostris extrusa]|uniref:Uncharacterized protein n=1 Tax=Caerostris extrusa TaxID=172846 RepID=A0AAV4QF67_CAEEX|nr:hypothetical protein CEXT_460461 [Caerostris extrusa]
MLTTPTKEYLCPAQSCINNHNHELNLRPASPTTKHDDYTTPRKKHVIRNPQCTSSVKTAKPISKENKFESLAEKIQLG